MVGVDNKDKKGSVPPLRKELLRVFHCREVFLTGLLCGMGLRRIIPGCPDSACRVVLFCNEIDSVDTNKLEPFERFTL